ncbi:MAG TPA: arginase family protein [Candidatus Limnocylindrales bacterium]|nr:arginase family protein [Candidatus Limnocylindrales bacterium]
MKIPHFFKAKSRLGLINPPIRHEKINRGVEDAPDYILSENFLRTIPEKIIDEFTFSKPEEVERQTYYSILSKELKNFTDLINTTIMPGQTQIVIGGDNSVTFSSLLAVINRTRDIATIGYLQFDSHGEMHLFSTSVSKNFHGMYMRPFFDKFDVVEIENLIPNKLKLNQALTIGDIIFEENLPNGEAAFHKNIRNINREEYLNNKASNLSEIQNFITNCEHLHVNFDIDVFKAESVGPSGMGDEGKWIWEDTLPIIDLIRLKENISLDIVEINPKITGAERTVKTAQEIIALILR